MTTHPLLPEHRAMLVDGSAITSAVIAARGYRSVTAKAELARLGFGRAQQAVPSLVMPVWGVAGEVALYQHRPDEPRVKDGKALKYEFPAGARMALDVHPFLRDKVRNPSLPLFITEGIKKADAAVSIGLCCIAVLGVWNWRGTNERGGKTALPDWEGVALKGRQVYVCFDSDVMLKREVADALARLAAFLKSRGAKVAYLYLPAGEGAAKTGLDDYLAAGHGVDDLLALATTELRTPPGEETDEAGGARVLWEGEPEKIARPLALLPSGSCAVVSLPVAVPADDGATVKSVDTPFVVTGDRELLTQRQALERGLQLEVGDATPARWSKAGVKRFLEGHRPHGRELLDELSRTFRHYVAFEAVEPLTEGRMADLLSVSVMASYFADAFPAIPYLHFVGGKGSGKSKGQELHASLSFNGAWVIATTTTAAIRRVAASGGLIAIDDTENLNPKDDPERYSLLLSGYRNGATFQLVEDDGNGGKRVRSIPIYGMRTFSSIKEMHDTLRSRLIPVPLVRSTGPQANRSPGVGPMPCRPFPELSDDVLAYALPRLREAAGLYARLATRDVMTGRDFDVTGPLLTVAYLVGGVEFYRETLSTLKALLSLRDEQGDEPREAPVLRALLRLTDGVNEVTPITSATVAGWIEQNDPDSARYTDRDGNERSRYSAFTVGKLLQGLKVGRHHHDRTGNWFDVDPALLARRAEAFGGRARLLREEAPEEPSQPSQASQPSPEHGPRDGCDGRDGCEGIPEGVARRGDIQANGNGYRPEVISVLRHAMPTILVDGEILPPLHDG